MRNYISQCSGKTGKNLCQVKVGRNLLFEKVKENFVELLIFYIFKKNHNLRKIVSMFSLSYFLQKDKLKSLLGLRHLLLFIIHGNIFNINWKCRYLSSFMFTCSDYSISNNLAEILLFENFGIWH